LPWSKEKNNIGIIAARPIGRLLPMSTCTLRLACSNPCGLPLLLDGYKNSLLANYSPFHPHSLVIGCRCPVEASTVFVIPSRSTLLLASHGTEHLRFRARYPDLRPRGRNTSTRRELPKNSRSVFCFTLVDNNGIPPPLLWGLGRKPPGTRKPPGAELQSMLARVVWLVSKKFWLQRRSSYHISIRFPNIFRKF
jgi:hypothetical protein